MGIMPSARSAFGIGKESTAGTAVAASRWAPWSKLDPVEKPTPLVDEGMRASMGSEYDIIMGPQASEGTLEGPMMVDTIGDLLLNILGGYAVGAAVSGVYPHTLSLLNSGSAQPATHTLVDYQQLTASTKARVYPYACLSELTLSGNAEGLVTVSGKFSSAPSAAAGVEPTNTPTSERAIPAWRSTVTVGGSTVRAAEWSVTISRELQTTWTADGSQSPYVIGRGGVTVSGKYTLVALDETPLTSAVAGTQAAHVITISNGGSTSALRSLALTMTKGVFTEPQMKRDGALLGWDVAYKSVMNSTDAGASGGLAPLKAVLNNVVADHSA